MAHVRKDTTVPFWEWWKHLRDYKAILNRIERREAKRLIKKEIDNAD